MEKIKMLPTVGKTNPPKKIPETNIIMELG